MRLPKEVAECPNLKHINLLENEAINWKESDSTLTKLKPETRLYISIANLDSLLIEIGKLTNLTSLNL